VMISLPARCALLAVHDMPAGQPQAGLVHLAPRNHACCMGAGGRQGRHCQFQDSSQLMHAHRPIKLFPCRTATLPGQGGTGGQDANMVIRGGGRSPGREPLSWAEGRDGSTGGVHGGVARPSQAHDAPIVSFHLLCSDRFSSPEKASC
jgi:hypothetical protein